MLRVTVQSDGGQTVIRVEGKLAGPALSELEHCWLQTSGPLIVDVQAATFAGEDGRQLLARMHQSGAKLVSSGTMMNAVVEKIAKSSNGSHQER